MAGYTRVDTGNNIADGNVISAADLDNEFDGIQAAFNASTGHNHDGTTGEGAPILVLGPTQDVVVGASTVTPKTTNTVDIGSSSLKFKDLYLAGNASIGGTLAVTGVATLTAQPILSSLTASRAVFTDGSKGLVSNAITGTGNVVMSASPTLTGTITAEALTTSSTVTLNGGTANGVAYLNGSKVLTTGSALTFDGTGLFSVVAASGVGVLQVYENSTGNNNRIQISQVGTVTTYNSTFSAGSGAHAWQLGGSEQARLTSTGLGIGTSSPGYKLDVNGYGRFSSGVIGSGGLTMYGDASSATGLLLNTSGNLGLGVTPSASTLPMLQSSFGILSGNSQTNIIRNGYYTDSWRYTTSSTASLYSQISGQHQWYTAPSGTAGNAISFTQAMTLDASGNLGVGATSITPVFGRTVKVYNAGSGGTLEVGGATVNARFFGSEGAAIAGVGTTTNTAFNFITNDAERARISSTGNFLINTTGNGSPGLGVANGQNISFPESTNNTSLATMFRQSSSGDLVLGSGVRYSATANAFASSTGDAWARTAINVGYGAIKFFTAAEATVAAGTNTTLTERARIDSSGNLLVGTTSHSDGSMFQTTGTTPLNSYRATTTPSGGIYGAYSDVGGTKTVRAYFRVDGGLANYSANDVNLSDERLKKDVSLASNYLEKICSIPVKNFRYKDQSEFENITLGVIAQDVLAVAPELVSEEGFGLSDDDKQNYLSVYQTDLQYALMKCIQEQQAIIEDMKTRLAAAGI